MQLIKIISGGQSGVDRAALDIAIKLSIPYGGFCPRGGWAEDFLEPPGLLTKYPNLEETISSDPAQRTEQNIINSHATIILIAEELSDKHSPGTQLTQQLCYEYHKPVFMGQVHSKTLFKDILKWLHHSLPFSKPFILNIAGPRESESTGIYQISCQVLNKLLSSIHLTIIPK